MLFTSWHELLRVIVAGVLAYTALVILLRISGKRTLSKMNAFDLVVTVALGSSLSTALLSSQVAVVEAIVGFAVLIGLQFTVAWLSVRSRLVRHAVKSQPTLVFWRGEFLSEALRRERLTEGEVRAAVREQNLASMEEIDAIVLETDGELSVIPEVGHKARALIGVRRATPDVPGARAGGQQ